MLTAEIIKLKRDGRALPPEAIRALVDGYVAGEVPDYQMAAFCMAVFFRGMDGAETAALTDAMLRSGDVLDLSDMPGVKVDKHSTGGVGDKVSLALAPLAAACGVVVPMISGRGLGHTGGTLDKLESIPGFQVRPLRWSASGRCWARWAPASSARPTASPRPTASSTRCATSPPPSSRSRSSPSSIMSKKLAEGIDALVLDVKVGSGAFMKQPADAERLARALVDHRRADGQAGGGAAHRHGPAAGDGRSATRWR